jgi:hypothetical protein
VTHIPTSQNSRFNRFALLFLRGYRLVETTTYTAGFRLRTPRFGLGQAVIAGNKGLSWQRGGRLVDHGLGGVRRNAWIGVIVANAAYFWHRSVGNAICGTDALLRKRFAEQVLKKLLICGIRG